MSSFAASSFFLTSARSTVTDGGANSRCCRVLSTTAGLGFLQHIRLHFMEVLRLFEQGGRGMGFIPSLP